MAIESFGVDANMTPEELLDVARRLMQAIRENAGAVSAATTSARSQQRTFEQIRAIAVASEYLSRAVALLHRAAYNRAHAPKGPQRDYCALCHMTLVGANVVEVAATDLLLLDDGPASSERVREAFDLAERVRA